MTAPKLTALSGNEIFCMRLKGLTPCGVVIGNSIQSMGFLGGVRSAFSGAETPKFSSAGDAQELYCHMDCGYDPKEFVFGNIAYSVGAVVGIAGTLKTLVRGEIREFSDVFNQTRHHGYMPIKLLISTSVYSLPAQAIIRDKDTWVSGLGGWQLSRET